VYFLLEFYYTVENRFIMMDFKIFNFRIFSRLGNCEEKNLPASHMAYMECFDTREKMKVQTVQIIYPKLYSIHHS